MFRFVLTAQHTNNFQNHRFVSRKRVLSFLACVIEKYNYDWQKRFISYIFIFLRIQHNA